MKKISTLFFALALCCCTLSSFAQISFSQSPGSGCTPLTVTFFNTSTDLAGYEYRWDFGDGSPLLIGPFTPTVNHVYLNKGTYIVNLVVYNAIGFYVGQYSPPTALVVNGLSSYDQVNIYPDKACPNQNVSINAPWGFPTYIFNFGDGAIDTATTNFRNHQYSAVGNYIVSVKILDVCNGSSATLSDTVSILSSMYFSSGGGSGNGVYFSHYPYETCPKENVSFYTGYGFARYIWNFGDGSIDTTLNANANHKYNNIGNYPVSVKVINFCGNDTTLYDTARVRYSPFPNMSVDIYGTYFNDPIACPGEQLNFAAPYGYMYYVWDYGDGSAVDSGFNAYKNHIYTNPGTYIASVRLHQTCGNDTTLRDTVFIMTTMPFPNWITLDEYPDPACPFKEINFYAPWGFPSYQWTWGDGTPVQTTGSNYQNHTYTSGGIYNISMKMTNLCGDDTTLTDNVTIDPNLPFPPGTTMTIDNGTPSCPGKVNFSASYGFQYYIWDFGDGNTETSINSYTFHSYPAIGTYSVSVKLIDHCGKDTTIYRSLAIQYQPFPPGLDFNVYNDNSCPNQNIQFSAPWGYVSYKWNFGDGNTLTGSNYVNHSYNAVGQYIVTVKIKQLCGNDTTLSKIVKVINNQAFPNGISVSGYPNNACPGESINFNGPWGFANYLWDFGDGNTDTTTNGSSSHSYTASGSFSVSLRIFNFCGLDTILYTSVSIDTSLGINGANMNAWFPNGMSACPGEMVNFNASWNFPYYTWDFGDGTDPLTGSFNFINHAYPEGGTYIAQVTIANECGNDTTVTQTITIDGNKPIGMLPVINRSPWMNQCPGAPITFTGPTGYAAYVWKFGDGSAPDSTTSNSVTHSFAAPGNFTVSLKIINYCGNDTTNTTNVIIDNTINPFTSITSYPNPICPDQTVVLSADTNFVSYWWDFGDGFSAYGSNKVNHAYSEMGSYSASVVITNNCGNSDTSYTTINVDTATSFPSWMNLWSNSWGVCPGDVTTLNTQPGFSSYFWDFGDDDTMTTSGPTIGHVYELAGSYTASVTINNGCGNSTTLTNTITINSNTSVNAPNIYTALNAYCPGDAVMFLLNDWGGGSSQNYTYYWDFGDDNTDTTYGIGATHLYDSAGTYTTIVTIENQCGNSTTMIVPVNINDNTMPTLNGTLWGTLAQTGIVGCPGDAVVFYFQGTGDNLWDFGDGSTGVATEEFINSKGVLTTIIKHAFNSDGSYSVKLTLTNGCGNSITDSISIQIMSNLLVDGGLILEPPMGTNSYTTCRELNFVAYGGSSYEWDFGDGNTLTTISPTVSHIYANPDNYAVSVLITNACGNSTSFSNAVNISASGGPSADSTSVTNATCYGGSDGMASVIVTDGYGPFTYLWSDESGQTGSTATGLAAGTYFVTVYDGLGCETETSVSVSEAVEIELSTSSSNTSCGGSTGSSSVSILSGGNFPFSYAWSSGSLSSTATGLVAGSYTVTVTDASGCMGTSMVAVSDINGPAVTSDNTANISCNGNSNGSISISASGSNTPFTYLWSNNSTTDDVSGLSAGSYAVTVTDNAGCKAVEIFALTEPDKLSVSFSVVGTQCGEANGSASISVSGGTPAYTYLWDSNTGSKITATVTGLSANAYHVTVTDSKGCTAVGVVTINNSNAPSLSVSKTNISCPGLSDGEINLAVTEGTTPYSFIWTWTGGSSFIEDLSGLDAGVYTVMVQDASNCWVGTSVTLTEPSFSTGITVSDASCIGSSDGLAAVVVTGGASPYTYLWSNTASANSITGLSAGTYTVQVTDTNNCTISDTAVVEQPDALAITLSQTNVSCFGGSNGTANAAVTGGRTPYSYLWSSGSLTSVASVLSAGKYYLTVTDSCGSAKIDSVTISQPAQLVATMSKTNVHCYGGGDGTATVVASGGTSPYNYSWNNGQTTATAYGLFPDVQSVNVFDANGCLVSNNITITQPQQLSATASVSYVSCNAGSDGSVDITVSGGTSPYVYNWSNSAITEDVNGLTAGSYSVTITDSCGTAVTQSVLITQPGTLSVAKVISDVKCYGSNNGSVNLTASGGVSPYSFAWSNSAATEDISGLSPGTYYVTITDVCSQTTADSAVVSQPVTLTTTVSKTNVSCNGMGDGTATVTPSGGTSPYNYNWNNGQTSSTAVGLFPGNYSVNVVDVNGCLASGLVSITQPLSLSVTSASVNVSCNSGNDGSVNITISGGTSPYIYSWSNSATTQNVSGLSAGSYSVTITDSCGTSVTQSVQITQPAALTITKVVSDVKCNGANNGTVTLAVSGGVTPYSYSWSNGAGSKDISNLVPGTYYVTVSDACAQIKNDSAAISQPATLTSTISKTDVSCNGSGDGTATVTPSGGTSPYSYNWNYGQTTQTSVGLFPGNYSVNVVDVNGCLTTGLVTITQPQSLSATASVSYVSCNAGSDGSVNITVSGGTSPYAYSWSNLATTEDVSGLVAGTYSVTITDSCGASVTQSAQITQPGALTFTKTVSDVKCNGSNNGAVNLTVSGGVTPYSYSWSNNATTEDITNLSPDTYLVTVTDVCSQSSFDSAIVNQPATLTAVISKTNVSCNGLGDGTATVSPSGGTSPYTYNWNYGQTTQTAVGLFPGSYSVNVVDVNGCLATGLVTITQPQVLSAISASANVSCNAGNDGSVNITVSGGTPPFVFEWSNSATTEDIAGLTAGSYSVTITDSCGTAVTQSAQITQPVALSVAKVISGVQCNGAGNGSVSLSVSGGVSPYTYLWSNNETTEDITNLAPGVYYVSVSDFCGQTYVDSASVNEPDVLTAAISNTNVSCYGMGDGTATVNATGGTTPYIYQWNNGQSGVSAAGLFAGFYSVNVFDANNCLASNSVVISQPLPLNVSINATQTTCGNSDAFASAIVSGGTVPYSYSWSNSSSDSAVAGLNNGFVGVTVTDGKGCVAAASHTIGIFVPPVEICLVTVDSSNTKNTIVWEKPMVNYIDSFRIYRDVVGTYTKIGSVSYADLSKFVDNTFGVNPSVTSYRYKVSAIDTCGNESALSPFHKTIHLTTNLGSQGEANLIWDGYDGFGMVNFYFRILRDSTGAGNYEVLDSVSNSNFTFSDWNVPAGLVNYSIEVVHPYGGCTVTKSVENHNSSRSNRGQTANGSSLNATVSVTDASSPSDCDGLATVTATGGLPPYTYQWDAYTGSQTTMTATGLCAGFYEVTVTDNNGNVFVTFANVDALIGVQEIPFADKVFVFPNPNSGRFTLEINFSGAAAIFVYDVLGQEVETAGKMLEPGKKMVQLDISKYGAGFYSLKVLSGNTVIFKPVIVE